MQSIATGMRHWFGILSGALPGLTLGWILLDVWRQPMQWDEGRWVPLAVGLMVLEFIIIHSSVFMAVLAVKSRQSSTHLPILAGMLALYILIVAGISASFGDTGLVWIFLSVVTGRLIGLFSQSGEDLRRITKRSGISMLLYLLAAFASILLPIPELGITPEVVNQVYPNRGGGLWEREPQRAIAMASAYFLLMGLVEILVFGLRNNKRKTQ